MICISTKIAGAVFALLKADLFSPLIGTINEKGLCKTHHKNLLQLQLEPRPYCRP